MRLEARIKQLESKVISRNILEEYSFDLDQCIAYLGLTPIFLLDSSIQPNIVIIYFLAGSKRFTQLNCCHSN